MHSLGRVICFVVLGALGSGCGAELSISPSPLRDMSAPAATKAKVSTLMVLPPRGSERGQRSELVDVERVLLEKGFRIISSGITGRVASGPAEVRADEASRLSDLERVLILARASNAEAILQVGEIGFRSGERHFTVLEGDRSHFREVLEPPANPNAFNVRIKESRFSLQGRLINVENGEIVVSLDISQGTSQVTPPIKQKIYPHAGETILSIDSPQRRQAAVAQVLEAFSRHVSPRLPSAK